MSLLLPTDSLLLMRVAKADAALAAEGVSLRELQGDQGQVQVERTQGTGGTGQRRAPAVGRQGL